MACWLGSQVRQNYQTIFWLYRATGSGLKMVRTTAGISVRVTLQAEMGFTEIWGLVAVNSVLLHFPSVFSFSQWSLWGKTCVGLLGNVLLCWGSRYPPWVLSRSLFFFFFFPHWWSCRSGGPALYSTMLFWGRCDEMIEQIFLLYFYWGPSQSLWLRAVLQTYPQVLRFSQWCLICGCC